MNRIIFKSYIMRLRFWNIMCKLCVQAKWAWGVKYCHLKFLNVNAKGLKFAEKVLSN